MEDFCKFFEDFCENFRGFFLKIYNIFGVFLLVSKNDRTHIYGDLLGGSVLLLETSLVAIKYRICALKKIYK